MRRILLALALLGLADLSPAQEGGGLGGYSAMQIERVGRFRGSFAGTVGIREMADGVRITLISDDPALQPLPIRANVMRFNWPEGADTPTAITMEGNVEVQHPQASVKADRAEWDFEKGELVFTGNPIMNSDTVKGLRGNKMVINFKENYFDVMDMQAESVPLRREGGAVATAAADPSLLTQDDVKDWTGLITVLKGQAREETPSPGRQIASKLDPDIQRALVNATVDGLVAEKATLLKQLNKVIEKPGLYEEAAFSGIELSEEAKSLLPEANLDRSKQIRLNRLLLQAAYPEFIAAR